MAALAQGGQVVVADLGLPQGLRGIGGARRVVVLDHRVVVVALSDPGEERRVVDDAGPERHHVVAHAVGRADHAVLGVEERVAPVVADDQAGRVEDVLPGGAVVGGVLVELVLGDVRPEDVHLQPDHPRVGDLEEVLQFPDARTAGRPALVVQRAAVEQETVGAVVVVGVELDALPVGDRAEGVPLVGGHVPVGAVGAAGGVAAGAHVVHAEDVGDLQVLLEGVLVRLGQRPGGRDEAVVALGAQPVVVEPGAQQPGALDGLQAGAARCVGVLVVSGELHLAVAVPGQLLEDLAEAGGQVGGEGVAGGGVADGVEDDAALVRRDEDLPVAVAVSMAVVVVSVPVVGERRGGAEDGGGDGSGRHRGAGAEEAAPVHAEGAAQALARAVGGRVGAGVGAGGVGERGHGCLPSGSWPARMRFGRAVVSAVCFTLSSRISAGVPGGASAESGQPEQELFHVGGRDAVSDSAGGGADEERTVVVARGEAAVAASNR